MQVKFSFETSFFHCAAKINCCIYNLMPAKPVVLDCKQIKRSQYTVVFLLNIILRYVKNAYYSHNSLAKASIFSAFSSFNAERIRTVF